MNFTSSGLRCDHQKSAGVSSGRRLSKSSFESEKSKTSRFAFMRSTCVVIGSRRSRARSDIGIIHALYAYLNHLEVVRVLDGWQSKNEPAVYAKPHTGPRPAVEGASTVPVVFDD